MNLKIDFFRKNKINPERAKKVLVDYNKDKNGNIIIKQGHFMISTSSVANYNFSDSWIFLSQPGVLNRQGVSGRMALVKSYISDKYPEDYKGSDAEITNANNFILPEIAKQFQLDAAEYYNVVFEDGEELQSDENYTGKGRLERQKIKPNKRYLLTPSFKSEDEELIHFADILDNRNELMVSKMISQMERYLKIRQIPETDIEQVKKSFMKQCIFNKFIDFSDEHNLNSGIIIKESSQGRRARLAPSYDLDFAAGVYNTLNGGFQPLAFFRKSDDGNFNLIHMLQQFKGDFEKEYLREILDRINIPEAIKIGEKYGNFKLTETARKKYYKFFKGQIEDLKMFYDKTYGEKANIER